MAAVVGHAGVPARMRVRAGHQGACGTSALGGPGPSARALHVLAPPSPRGLIATQQAPNPSGCLPAPSSTPGSAHTGFQSRWPPSGPRLCASAFFLASADGSASRKCAHLEMGASGATPANSRPPDTRARVAHDCCSHAAQHTMLATTQPHPATTSRGGRSVCVKVAACAECCAARTRTALLGPRQVCAVLAQAATCTLPSMCTRCVTRPPLRAAPGHAPPAPAAMHPLERSRPRAKQQRAKQKRQR